ncbi:MAG: hypothetical protein HYZ53_16925 [Planctomycetes bacterium]|nr:hypothetical protein [Planctomycetota bacterium]
MSPTKLLVPAAFFAALACLPGDALAGPRPGRAGDLHVNGVASSGEQTEAKVDKLVHNLAWQKNLEDAKALAKKSGKMIFWMHILGDLDGTT